MGSAAVQGELWGAEARDWADLAEPSTAPLWRAILDAAGVGPGKELLDIGCGAGGFASLAAQRGAKVYGLDASEVLLKIARERVPSGTFEHGDSEHLPYPDGRFDVVVACNSIQFAEDQKRAAREARRVLKAEGKFAIGMWCEPERCDMSSVSKSVASLAPAPSAPTVPSLSEKSNLIQLVESAGFRVVHEGDVECPFEFESLDTGWRTIRSAGMLVALRRKLGEDRVKDAVLPALEPFRAADGSVRLSNWFRYLVCEIGER